MQEVVKHLSVLGTRVACVDYREALAACVRMAREQRPAAVSACNTHIVAHARHDPEFRRVMDQFDLILPDGMPLMWALNRKGAELQDRVYGPYFMRHALMHAGRDVRHFFFGGTEETLAELVREARAMNPEFRLAGTFSPPFREWTEADEAEFARRISESGADFIWVALGGERQEKWIIRNLLRYRHGVFFAVGDAFALLAGQRPFAPGWMQKFSLTWFYRLMQEPRRLGMRYLKYNSLFLYYMLRDGLLGEWRDGRGGAASVAGRLAEGPAGRVPRKYRIAFLGSRGVPARYSGFETVVEELGSRLAQRGHHVTVYNRLPHYREIQHDWKEMRLLWYPTIPSKNLESIVHTSLAFLDSFFRGYDVLYFCGVGNTPITRWPSRLAGFRVVVNVDGADFKRKKWGRLARWWLRKSEERATWVADAVIADNQSVVARYQRVYGYEPVYLTYGAPIRLQKIRAGELERWGLEPGKYILHVSRLTPENETDLLLKAHARMTNPPALVVVGSAGYERDYQQYLESLAGPGVVFTGGRFSVAYFELSQHAAFFVMPATIEATRLVLLDQMGMGKAILYHDCPASREVLGEAAEPFWSGERVRVTTQAPENRSDRGVATAAMGVSVEQAGDDLVQVLADKMAALYADPVRCAELGEQALARARGLYSWDVMVDRYEELFEKLRSA